MQHFGECGGKTWGMDEGNMVELEEQCRRDVVGGSGSGDNQ